MDIEEAAVESETDEDRERAENRFGGLCASSLALACSTQALLLTSLSLSGILSSKSNRSPTNERTVSYPEIRARVAAAWLPKYNPGPPIMAIAEAVVVAVAMADGVFDKLDADDAARRPSRRGPC